MANPNERIRVIVEPDTSGFARELQADLSRINTELTVEVLADTEPAAAEIKTAKAKAEATPVEVPVLADTAAAKAEMAKFNTAASKPIEKLINASVGPALAKVREFTTEATKPIIKSVVLRTTGAVNELRTLDAKAQATFAGIGSKARSAAGKMSTAFAGFRRIGTGALLPVGLALGGIGLQLKAGKEDADKYSETMASLRSVLVNAGKHTGITAAQVKKLSGALEGQTGVAEESIAEGVGAIVRVGGVSRKTLPKVTQALLDMSVAMKGTGTEGVSLKANAIKLGRALNDPTKALTLFKRQGVSFSASQTKVIGKLVETGKVGAAQSIILKQLGERFKGSASAFGKTTTGQLLIARDAFEDARRDLTLKILPSIAPVVKQMASGIASALNTNQGSISRFVTGFIRGAGAVLKFVTSSKTFHQILSGISAIIVGVAKGIKGFALSFASAFSGSKTKTAKSFGQTIKDLGKQIGEVANKWLPKFGGALGSVAGFLTNHKTIIKAIVAAFIAYKAVTIGATIIMNLFKAAIIAAQVVINLWKVALFAIRAATKAWSIAQVVLNAVLAANPIALVVIAVAALVAIFVIAWKHSETFKKIIVGAFHAVRSAVSAVINWFKKAIPAAFNAVVSFLRRWGPIIIAVISGPIGIAVLLITKHWHQIWKTTVDIFNKIKSAVSSKLNDVIGFVRGLRDRIIGIFSGAGSWLLDAGKRIIGGLRDGLVSGWHKIEKWLGGLKDKIISLKGPPATDSTLLVDNGQRIMGGLHEGMKQRWEPISGWLGNIAPWMKEFVSKTKVGHFAVEALLGEQDPTKIGKVFDPFQGILKNIAGSVGAISGIGPAPNAQNVFAQATALAKAFGVATGSWLRSRAANTAAGGAPNSQHLMGYAVDFPLGGAATEAELDRLASFAKQLIGKAFTQVLWHVMDHFDHVHIGWLHKRAGGRVRPGEPTIVGETGQEGFIPDRPGMILSNNKLNMLLALSSRVSKLEATLNSRRTGDTSVAIRERAVVQQTNNIELVHPSNDPSSIMAALNSRLSMFARTATAGLTP